MTYQIDRQAPRCSSHTEKPVVQYLIGGVQKAGTTALQQMLSQHPALHMPDQKELHFFDNEDHFKNGKPNYDNYHRWFSARHSWQLCGEATPSYIFLENAVSRVMQYNSSMKWIILLRNPVSRAYSHWNMQFTRGIEKLNFLDALEAEPHRLANLSTTEYRKFAYRARSNYAVQIKQLFNYFDKKQCLFLTNETVRENSELALQNISTFLNIPYCHIDHINSHVGAYATSLSMNYVNHISNFFNDDIAATEELTRLTLTGWKT